MAGKKEGVASYEGQTIVALALRLNKLPEEIEQMDVYWFNRLLVHLECESESYKIKK